VQMKVLRITSDIIWKTINLQPDLGRISSKNPRFSGVFILG
jgi:hypothetical protein